MQNFLEITNNSDIFQDLTTRHTKFQLENFVLGQEQAITIWGKYKQVLRELNTRVRNLKDSRYQNKKKKIEIRKLERKFESEKDELEKEGLELDIENEKDNLKLMQQDEEEIVREGAVLTNAYHRIKAEVDKLLAEGKTKDQLEEEYWVEKLKNDMQNSVLSTSGASIGLLRAIRGLESKESIKTILNEYYQANLQHLVDKQVLTDQAVQLFQGDKSKLSHDTEENNSD